MSMLQCILAFFALSCLKCVPATILNEYLEWSILGLYRPLEHVRAYCHRTFVRSTYSVYVKKKNYVYYTCIRELARIQIFTLVPAYNHLPGLSIGQSVVCQKFGIVIINMMYLNVLEGVNHIVCYEISMLEMQQTRKEYRISGNFDQFVTDFDRFVYGFRSISVFDFYGFRHYYTWSIRGNHGIRIQYVYTCDLFTYIPTQKKTQGKKKG